MLKGKTVVIAVSGSIAAYKMPNVARMLKKLGADVQVLMTQNATQFINPITFESLTGNKCLIDTFDRNFQYSVEHVALAKRADVVLVAPASANVIGKLANGLADDMLTTTALACTCPKIIAPAMNTNMFNNPIVQDNIEKLKRFGMEVIQPDTGILACKDVGAGKLPSEEVLLDYILKEIRFKKDLAGKKVLVTAGPTVEAVDPVRFITNRSTGKMGYEIAKAARNRGAEVILVSGKTALAKPYGIKVIDVKLPGSPKVLYQVKWNKVYQNLDPKPIYEIRDNKVLVVNSPKVVYTLSDNKIYLRNHFVNIAQVFSYKEFLYCHKCQFLIVL